MTRTDRRISGPRTGALLAATAGTAFVLVNAGALDDAAASVVRAVGVLVGIAVTFRVLTRPEPAEQPPSPTTAAWRVYWAMVVLEVVLLLGGTRLLVAHGRDELATPWVALVVGLHFLPFARAFGTPLFAWLGGAMIGLGVGGGVLALAVGSAAGAVVAGVLSGVVLLGFALSFR